MGFHTHRKYLCWKWRQEGNPGICGGSHIDWRNAFEAFSSSRWMHFISEGQLLIRHILLDGKTDVGNKTELTEEKEEKSVGGGGGHQLLSYRDVSLHSASAPVRSVIWEKNFDAWLLSYYLRVRQLLNFAVMHMCITTIVMPLTHFCPVCQDHG